MNVAQLTGAQLDYWTAKAEGHSPELKHACGADYCLVGELEYRPSDNWHIAAPIVERQMYVVYPVLRSERKLEWVAEAGLNPHFYGTFVDESPKVAICRLRVAEVFGYEVQEAALTGETS